MLRQAHALVRRHHWTNVELVRSDAATLDGAPEHVDAVVSVWCLGIVHDIEAALERAIDLLRPGGRIAIMDFDRTRPDDGPLYWLYPAYRRALLWAGIDAPEDLDDPTIGDRWACGWAVLRDRLQDVVRGEQIGGVAAVCSLDLHANSATAFGSAAACLDSDVPSRSSVHETATRAV